MKDLEDFFKKVNKAFERGDMDFLSRHITDDFCWSVVGERNISMKEGLSEALEHIASRPPMIIEITNIIIDGKANAVVEGLVTVRNNTGQKKRFGFCDVFKLADSPEPKIRYMTSYVIDVSKHKRYMEGC